jgi:hypothetical protein
MNRAGAAIGGTSRLFTEAIPLRTSPWATVAMIENLLEPVDVFGWIVVSARGRSAYISVLNLALSQYISPRR